MATTPTTPVPAAPKATDPSALLQQALTTGIKIDIQGTLPGEALMTKIFDYASTVRTTMDKDLLKRLDAITVQQLEDWQAFIRGIWKVLGLLQ